MVKTLRPVCCSLILAAGLLACLPGCESEVASVSLTPPMTGFEQLAGQIVLVRFDSDAPDESSRLIETWVEQKTIDALHYVFVAKPGVAPEASETPGIVRVADPDGRLAEGYAIRSRPWYVLLDRHGRTRYSGASLPAEVLADWVAALETDSSEPGDAVAMFSQRNSGSTLLAATRLTSIDGKEVVLKNAVGESGIILLFSDTYCPYSEQSTREIRILSESFASLGYSVYVVNIGDSAERVGEFYFTGGRLGSGQYELLYDPGNLTQYTWNITTVPTVCVIDRYSEIRYTGPALWTDVAAAASKAASNRGLNVNIRGTGYG